MKQKLTFKKYIIELWTDGMIVVWRRCITKPYKYKSITMLSNHDVREEFYAFVHQNSFDPDDNDIKSILEGDDLEKLTEEAMMEAL